MNPTTRYLGLLALVAGLLTSIATAAPLSTLTTCMTTTITPPTSVGVTTTNAAGPISTSLSLTTTTITMPSSTTTSYTTVTAPVPTGSTVPEYGQCGGLGYAGPTTCDDPFVCVCTSDWWCQCRSAIFERFELQGKVDNIANVDATSPMLHPNLTTASYWAPDLRATMTIVFEPL